MLINYSILEVNIVPGTVEVFEFASVNLTCDISGLTDDQNTTFEWYKSPDSYAPSRPQYTELDVDDLLSTDQSFILYPLRSDAGVYVCQAKDADSVRPQWYSTATVAVVVKCKYKVLQYKMYWKK